MSKRIGVFVCHCGKNIAATVDVEEVTRVASKSAEVVHSEDYVYMCADPGQKLIETAIREKNWRASLLHVVHQHYMKKRSERQVNEVDSININVKLPIFGKNVLGFIQIRKKLL